MCGWALFRVLNDIFLRCLKDVLIEKYHWEVKDATTFAGFLTPMLTFFPPARSTAHECLQHSWLKI